MLNLIITISLAIFNFNKIFIYCSLGKKQNWGGIYYTLCWKEREKKNMRNKKMYKIKYTNKIV